MKPWKRPGMKVPRFVEKEFRFPVFSNFRVTVVVADNLVAASRYIADKKYEKEPNSRSEADAFTVTYATGYAYIYLKPNTDIGTIAHESYHAVRGILRYVGATEDEEVVAYHLGYLVDEIIAFNLKIAPRFKKGKTK